MSELNLEYIKKRRLELGLSQADISEMVGMNGKASYSRYENGIYSFNANHVPLLAKALKTSISNLYTPKVTKTEIASGR